MVASVVAYIHCCVECVRSFEPSCKHIQKAYQGQGQLQGNTLVGLLGYNSHLSCLATGDEQLPDLLWRHSCDVPLSAQELAAWVVGICRYQHMQVQEVDALTSLGWLLQRTTSLKRQTPWLWAEIYDCELVAGLPINTACRFSWLQGGCARC